MTQRERMQKAHFRFANACWLVFAAWVFLGCSLVARAAEKLPTVEFAFRTSAPEGVQITSSGETAFLGPVHRSGGAISADGDPAWRVDAEAPFGEGTLDFTLDRSRLAGDLALVLRADWQSKSDVAIQLFDASGYPLALDLFGNLAQNSRAAATDTFVVPLTRYPLATRLSVRRLSGPFTLYAAGLFPVLSELPSTARAQQAIADQLGLVFRPVAVPAVARKSTASGTDKESTSHILGVVHTLPSLETTNQIGATVLGQTGYPAFRRISEGTLASAKVAASGTTCDFVKAAVRALAIQSQSALEAPLFTSSNVVAPYLLTGKITVGVMSVPLTSAEKEHFFNAHGYPIMEFKVAHDAIEVLVNAANPLKEITIPQLDAIYSQSPRAGASEPLRVWNDLGVGAGEIHAYGGFLEWGTAKSFQQLVLKGGEYRPDITAADVVYRDGIEEKVAADTAAIGYVSLRTRQPDVRVLAVASNSGERAWPVNAETIYSGRYPLQRAFYGYVARKTLADATPFERELVNLLLSDAGQVMVANSGSLPLGARETMAARDDVALPR